MKYEGTSQMGHLLWTLHERTEEIARKQKKGNGKTSKSIPNNFDVCDLAF
jgi:hypothetical protein